MTKVTGTPKSATSTPNLKKHGGIQKNKTPKFKNTPTGKVALINGKTPNKNEKTPKPSPLAQSNGVSKTPKSNQNTPKGGKKSLPASPAKKVFTPKNQIAPKAVATPKNGTSPKKINSVKKSAQKGKEVKKVSPKKDSNKKKLDLEKEASDESINEGISLKEDSNDDVDEESDDDSNGEDLPSLLGQSLNDDSDEDDDDFKEENDKSKKILKGLKKASADEDGDSDDDEMLVDSSNSLLEQSDSDDEDEDDDDIDDEEDESEESISGLKNLSGNSLDDEDDDDSEEDDDDESEDESSVGLKDLLGDSLKDDEDDEDFDEEDEDDDLSEDDEGTPKKVVKKSKQAQSDESPLDEDDEDFEEGSEDEGSNDDEDSPKTKIKVEKKLLNESTDSNLSEEAKEERNKRSIYVGNVPKEATQAELEKVFKKFGSIETMRFRGIVPENPKMSLKLAKIKKKLHPKVLTVYAFITFKEEESAKKSLEMNGQKFKEHFLRVDLASEQTKYDHKKAVFLGNLPFECEENAIWNHFNQCGQIQSVRIVRHRSTGLNKGFGYVNFKTEEAAVIALELHGSKIKNREIRVMPCTERPDKKPRKNKGFKRSHSSSFDKSQSPKKLKIKDENDVATHNSKNAEKRKEKKNKNRSPGQTQSSSEGSLSPQKDQKSNFQGQKADQKKKQKSNKQDKKKKIMAEKLMAKPSKKMAD